MDKISFGNFESFYINRMHRMLCRQEKSSSPTRPLSLTVRCSSPWTPGNDWLFLTIQSTHLHSDWTIFIHISLTILFRLSILDEYSALCLRQSGSLPLCLSKSNFIQKTFPRNLLVFYYDIFHSL